MESILAEIKVGMFRPVYIFYGPDLMVSDEVIQLLREKLLRGGLEMFDYDLFNGGEIGKSDGVSVEFFVQRTNQPPVGSQRRLIVVRHLEQMGIRVLREFCSGLLKVPDFTTVVAVCGYERERDREFRSVFKETGVSKFVVAAKGARDETLRRQVQNWVRAAGLEIDDDAVGLLVAIVGEDSLTLKGEVDKFQTALDPGALITPEIVRQYASSTRIYELRDYVRCCVERNLVEALALLRRLEETGEEPKTIVSWLAYALLDVLAVKLKAKAQESLWRVSPTAVARWSVGGLDRALNELFAIDFNILQGHREPFALLEIWTVKCGSRIIKKRLKAGVKG